MSEPVTTIDIDSRTGILMPNFDNELNILWLVGKGELSLKYYEYKNGMFLYYNNEFKT